MRINGLSSRLERFCIPRGESFPLTPEGFLQEPSAWLFSLASGAAGLIQPVATVAECGAMVLLGEPGAGKTTNLRELVGCLPDWTQARADEDSLAWVDLIEVQDGTFGELVAAPLRRLPFRTLPADDQEGQPSRAGGLQAPWLTLVLDGLDECTLPPKRLVRLLKGALANRDLKRLRLFVGCRSADYPQAVDDLLEELLPHRRIVELAPLTRQQVVAFAEGKGVPANAFVDAVVAAGVGALAAIPLTLIMLLKEYQEGRGLARTAPALFEQAVLALADEPDPERRDSFAREGSPHQRVAVAARIAAALLLCGKAAVWRGHTLAASALDIPDGGLAGGREPAPAGPFEVTSALVQATLGTALFTSRGSGRLGLIHPSIAAFLAARYLVGRGVPEPQLRNLLISATEPGRARIHSPLREVAAWMVALAPAKTSWLAGVDPYNIAIHAAVIESPDVREQLVQSLLDQADTAWLQGHRFWARPRWALTHPGLAGQLRPVLAAAVAEEPTRRPAREQVALAINLARDGGAAELVTELCAIAADRCWDGYLRSWAARAAAQVDRDRAAPRLRGLLGELDAESDPDDELRGQILKACWPEHLTLDELLDALTPPRNPDLLGAYRAFRWRLPERLSEQDLPTVLRWACQHVRTASEAFDFDPERSTVEEELFNALIDRALDGPSAIERVELVAKLIIARWGSRELMIPAPLDVVDATGREPAAVQALRRALIVALLHHAMDDQGVDPVDLLTWGWQQRNSQLASQLQGKSGEAHLAPARRTSLVDRRDLEWFLELEATADDAMAGRLHDLIRFTFDRSDHRAQELAWNRRGTRVWKQVFAPYFDAVDLTSEAAARAREHYRMLPSQSSTPEQQPWSERDGFARSLQDRLAQAAAGEPTAFWQLCHLLQVEPGTGQGTQRWDDDITTWPSTAVLQGGWRELLLTAARQYLHTEHAHEDEWLGTTRCDRRAWAGYLALALLARHNLLDNIEPAVWTRWAPAILWFPTVPVGAGDGGLKSQLLAHLAAIAPDALANPAVRLLQGASPICGWQELGALRAAWTPQLAKVLVNELDRIIDQLVNTTAGRAAASDETAPSEEDPERLADKVELLARLLLDNQHPGGAQASQRLVKAVATHQSPLVHVAAARAASLLLQQDAQTHWPSVLTQAKAVPAWGDQLAIHLARSHEDAPVINQLDEPSLAELYVWLMERYPPENDVIVTGAHFVSPEEEVRWWRDRILHLLVARGSAAAIRVLADLVRRWPDRSWLKGYLLEAEQHYQEASWIPPVPAELFKLLDNPRRRLVRSSTELCDVLVTVLHETAEALPQHSQLLWNTWRPNGATPKSGVSNKGAEAKEQSSSISMVWRPKSEHDLSAYLKNQLVLRLASNAAVVNREVLVRQTSSSGAGHRVDLLVEATARSGSPGGAPDAEQGGLQPARVVIEVKGCWHRELLTAMRTQLANEYLRDASTTCGVYVVGWYPLDQWDPDDYRRRHAAQYDRTQVHQDLERQAHDLVQQQGLDVRVLIIDVPHPTHPGQSP